MLRRRRNHQVLLYLGHFYSFLLSQKPDEISVSSELVTQMKKRVRQWSSSYKRSSLHSNWEWQEEERHKLITPNKFVEFKNSKASRDAVILLVHGPSSRVTMECVRERIMECEILQGTDTRKIYDGVRAEWRNPIATPETLPTEKEELGDRVNRLFREDMPSFRDIAPPTSLSSTIKALFNASSNITASI